MKAVTLIISTQFYVQAFGHQLMNMLSSITAPFQYGINAILEWFYKRRADELLSGHRPTWFEMIEHC